MNPRLARRLTKLYPAAWRGRYGDEFEALLEAGPGDLRTLANGLRSAMSEHISPTHFPKGLSQEQGGNLEQDPNSFGAMIRRPSAFIPLAMSLSALAMVLAAVAVGMIQHAPRETDEGSVAHIWQLLMTVQVPIVAFFLIKWSRRVPGQAMRVLALQVGAWLASCAPVYFLNL
jgi:hypothetical protein